MNTRFIPVAICVTLGAAALFGQACTSIPDSLTFREEESESDGGGDGGRQSGSGGRGSGGKGSAGKAAAGSGAAGSGSGGSATGGAGGKATGAGGRATGGGPGSGGAPSSCGAEGDPCADVSECCDTVGGAACVYVTTPDESSCTSYCTLNSECASGCCIPLLSGRGACFDQSECGTGGCRDPDATCDFDSDCCSGLCVAQFENGPRLCRPACSAQADCAPEICVPDGASGGSACATSAAGLCTDTCATHGNGQCEDGGEGSSWTSCALGSDCRDCGARIGGNEICNENCGSTNGICEDGGPGASGAICSTGADCTDCGSRLTICTNTCAFAFDGECDYDGVNCAPGTDCEDCGAFFGGRDQRPCDGSVGGICRPFLGDIYNVPGSCECSDCKWDQADCGSTNQCNGRAVSACCAASNPCGLNDQYCDCGGWCAWETECTSGGSTASCDPASATDACEMCMRTACCDSVIGCANQTCIADLGCLVDCLVSGLPLDQCGCAPDAAAEALLTCRLGSCAIDCLVGAAEPSP